MNQVEISRPLWNSLKSLQILEGEMDRLKRESGRVQQNTSVSNISEREKASTTKRNISYADGDTNTAGEGTTRVLNEPLRYFLHAARHVITASQKRNISIHQVDPNSFNFYRLQRSLFKAFSNLTLTP